MTEAEAIAAIQKYMADRPWDLSLKITVEFAQSGISVTQTSNTRPSITFGNGTFTESVKAFITGMGNDGIPTGNA